MTYTHFIQLDSFISTCLYLAPFHKGFEAAKILTERAPWCVFSRYRLFKGALD